jgi:hypothetical protein
VSVDPEFERHKYYLESQKVVLDFVKHVATLATGAIVLLASLLDKVFPNPQWKFLIIVTFVSLLISAVTVTAAAIGVVRSIRTPSDVSEPLRHFTAGSMIVGLVSFALGISTLAVFAARNWW